MGDFNYPQLLLRLLPETLLVIGALVVLFLDQAAAKSRPLASRSSRGIFLSVITLGLVIYALSHQTESGSFYSGMLVLNGFTRIARICVCTLGIATLLLSRPVRFTTHIGEYLAIHLLATLGLLFLAGAEELLTAFIALELASLSLYLLAGFNKQSQASAEAALKYFLFGSVAAAFTLFGISLVFGLAGSTSFAEIATVLKTQELSPLLIVALVMVAIGFAFKMAAAPLHFWAPDTYQGAPIPSAALVASGSKLASFVLFLKFFIYALPAQAGSASLGGSVRGWSIAIAAIAAVSIIVGNLLAIAQTNFRRLLAYSAVAHAGYVLIAVLARNELGLASGVYYLFTYGLSIIGTFAIAGILEKQPGELTIQEFAGLSRRAPLLAICLFVFILSLAGIPPLAGFFGKFYIFLAALDASRNGGTPGLIWIVALALAASAVSLFYYLQVLKQAFVLEDTQRRYVSTPFGAGLVILILAGTVVYLGCFPEVLNGPLLRALAIGPAKPVATAHTTPLSSAQPAASSAARLTFAVKP